VFRDVDSAFDDTAFDDTAQRPTKRRRVVAENVRKRSIRKCRRCARSDCPGNSDILKCPKPCTLSCKTCHRTMDCRGVDGGKKCTYNPN
jgi:hypothetical protein